MWQLTVKKTTEESNNVEESDNDLEIDDDGEVGQIIGFGFGVEKDLEKAQYI